MFDPGFLIRTMMPQDDFVDRCERRNRKSFLLSKSKRPIKAKRRQPDATARYYRIFPELQGEQWSGPHLEGKWNTLSPLSFIQTSLCSVSSSIGWTGTHPTRVIRCSAQLSICFQVYCPSSRKAEYFFRMTFKSHVLS